jgi:hypothetical protein
MKLNGIRKIDNNGGDYLVLTDYGYEGIAVSHQCDTAEKAVEWMLSSDYSSPHAVVKVLHASISSENES